MKVAMIMYERMNLESFSSLYYFFHKFDNFKIKSYAIRSEVKDELGIKILPEIYAESIYGADIIVIPDGIGCLGLRHDEIFLSWLKSAFKTKLKISVNLGSLLFGGAGFLEGYKAVIKGGYKNALNEYCELDNSDFSVCEDVVSMLCFDHKSCNKLNDILLNI